MGINNNAALEQVAARFDLDFCLVALPYTLLDHASLQRGMADLQRRGISAIIGAPFASGILVTGSAEPQHYAYGKAPPDIQTKVRVMERFAPPMAWRCLRWHCSSCWPIPWSPVPSPAGCG